MNYYVQDIRKRLWLNLVLYVHNTEGWIITVYVDDLLLLAKFSASYMLELLKVQLSSEFQMADMGPVTWFLRMRILRLQDGSYRLDQSRYIEDLLQKFRPARHSQSAPRWKRDCSIP
jgi:hypothetical protein